jgi:DNA-directed RNA polymerase specialized sigma24 family protein
MSVHSAGIIDQLPSLRRYASALIGAPARADDLVELCLERLLADQSRLSEDRLRLTMFALFDAVERQVREVFDTERSADAMASDGLYKSLYRLPIDERKALLLTSVEGFSHAEAAIMLRIPSALVAQRALAARERLRRALSRKVLVIEDDALMAMSIAHIVQHMGHEVCGVAHSRRHALAQVHASQPTLILADVRLRDGDTGIATVREIVRRRPVPVIFITGHAQDVIREQQLRPTLVIGKPFAPHTLEAAVRRVLGSAPAGAPR